jgi:uridine kinase
MARLSVQQALIIAGILLRIALVISFVPTIQAKLFAPFIEAFLGSPSIDPWQAWLNGGGSSDSFPYGPIMLFFFSVFGFLTAQLDLSFSVQIGMAFGLLAAELGGWFFVWKTTTTGRKTAILLFAISPIFLAATYIHGQLDLLPSVLLLIGLVSAKRGLWKYAGLFIGLSAATKFSALILIPFILIFLVRNARFRAALPQFVFWLLPGLAISLLPLLLPGYRTMVAGTPQVSALFAYSIPLGPDFSILVAPLFIAGFVALVWSYRRANLGMLFTICAVALAAFPLFMPSSPGWFLWGLMPITVLVASIAKRYAVLLFLLGFMEATTVLLAHTTGEWRWDTASSIGSTAVASSLRNLQPSWALDMALSMTLLLGIFTLWRVLAVSLRSQDHYRLSRAPLSVLVAGDSGTGKDTLCASLASVFGESRSAFILGDDYHSFERGSSAWGVKTHLDPAANDIPRLTKDSLDLLNGTSVWSRHYDHERGRFTKARKIDDGDLVAISGLHVIAIDAIRQAVDLSVFLDMDNDLRTLLKLERDMKERQQLPKTILASIKARETDRNLFIQPQIVNADLVISLKSAEAIHFSHNEVPKIPVLDVFATLRSLTFGADLVRSLASIGGAQAHLSYNSRPGFTDVSVKAADWISAEDIAAVASSLIKNQEEIFVERPQWMAGSRGISQLLIVLSILERRRSNAWRR